MLIEIIKVKETVCFPKSQIKEVEKIIRLHYELQINLEGIDAIYNLLKQIGVLQEEVVKLTNKLNRFHT